MPGDRAAKLASPVRDPLLHGRDRPGVAGRTLHANQFGYPFQHVVKFALDTSEPAETDLYLFYFQ